MAAQGSAPALLADGAGGRLQKARARDLLRKHYGLGVGPPPPLTGPGKPLDPMDIGMIKPEWILAPLLNCRFRLTRFRCQIVL